ncbi:heterokaryon incompatibility protein [Hirsutella rhossiliensis]
MADIQEPPELVQAGQLCDRCQMLDFEAMFADEVNEEPMGALSLYIDTSCPFCGLVSQAIGRAWGPGWDAARLGRSAANKQPQLFMMSRSPLSVKEAGRTEHPHPRLLLAISQEPPGRHRNRATLREIDQIKNRFLIAEFEALPHRDEEAHFLPRREIGSRIKPRQLRGWLDACQQHKHSREAASRRDDHDLFAAGPGFRLVDVADECLVQRTERCDYVALSYVWGPLPTTLRPGNATGQTPILLSTQQMIEELGIKGSLSLARQAERNNGRIPHTVRDTMELTRQIGMRYLWVDTLCIVQDDRVDQARLVGRMDHVYNSATVTVIAACGTDADAGLSGIRARRGHPIRSHKIVDSDGTTLNLSLCLPSLCDEVRRATWNMRGWTFQEQCLSRRCLYFTPDEVFFNCSETQWREGYDFGENKRKGIEIQVRTGPPWWSVKLRRDLDPTPYYYLGNVARLDMQDYQRAVQEFGRKNLTFASDVLNAFEGIFSRFSKSVDRGHRADLDIRQTQGLPSHLLFQAILWFPSDSARKRTCLPSQPGGVAESFSTWSWASWTGPIEFVFADSAWLSRNISQAPIKGVPLHVPITRWHFGVSTGPVWSREVWAACDERPPIARGISTEELFRTKGELGRVGIDVDLLVENATAEPGRPLACGELGFFGPCVGLEEFSLSSTEGQQVCSLEVSDHRGRFRFDGDVRQVDELVAFVVTNTITKPPDTQSIFLGLHTSDGVSARVGIGYVYYSKDQTVRAPKWRYRFFIVC